MELLREYAIFEYTPSMIKESRAQNAGRIVMSGILQKANTLNQNGRIYPLQILSREIRNYQKFINENRATGELDHPDCTTRNSFIHTKDGWKPIADCAEDEIVYTLNEKTNEIELQKIDKKIVTQYDGPLYRFYNSRLSFDITVTPGHRLMMKNRKGKIEYVLAADIVLDPKKYAKYSFIRQGHKWVGDNAQTFKVGEHEIPMKLWSAFMGIYLAEGHCKGVKKGKFFDDKGFNVCVTQYKADTRAEIKELISKLPFEWKEIAQGFAIRSKELYSYLYKFGHSKTKYIPKEIKDANVEFISEFLIWAMKGDGLNRKNYSVRGLKRSPIMKQLATISHQLANDYEELFIKTGSAVSITVRAQGDRNSPDIGRKILQINSNPLFIVSENVSSPCLDTRFLKIDVVSSDGEVFCVRTKNSNWLMKENGRIYWTGNSSVIELKNVSHIIREAKIDDAGVVYGKVELLDTPSGKILQSLVESGVQLGISSRGVGSVQKDGDYNIVQDDFQLICWDFVSEPSTPGAFMLKEHKNINQKLLENVFNKSDRIFRAANDVILTAAKRKG